MGFRLSNLLSDLRDDRYYLEAKLPKAELEVASSLDAFVSLEDIAPNSDWTEVLAATWGMPCPDSVELGSKGSY